MPHPYAHDAAFAQRMEMVALEVEHPAIATKLKMAWKVHLRQLRERGRDTRWRDYVRCIYVYCKLPREFSGE